VLLRKKAALDRIELLAGVGMAKEMMDWKLNITQVFQDVDQILGRQIDELAKDHKALEDKMKSGRGGSSAPAHPE
jgi:t-SNARE complex subunit (syntaxin)